MENFHKLRLLFFEEIDLRVLAELQGIDETGMLDKAPAIESLNLESGREFSPLVLHFLPVAIHVAEDDSRIVSHLDFFSRKKQIFVARIRQ